MGGWVEGKGMGRRVGGWTDLFVVSFLEVEGNHPVEVFDERGVEEDLALAAVAAQELVGGGWVDLEVLLCILGGGIGGWVGGWVERER